jgi:enoyl-CoA hydratase/carnithine racemase
VDQVLHDSSEAGVLTVTLNRPDALTACTPEMEAEYYAALRAADRDPHVRVVLVTGAGRGFCAGADLSGAVDDFTRDGAPLPARSPEYYPPVMAKPLIAAVNGACAGLGLALALQADVRFVATEAKITTAFVRRGLIAEHGVGWLLQRCVGRGRALDLLLSGRVFTGADAGAWGLAEFVTPAAEVLAAARAYAHELATLCSPRSMATIKRQLVADDAATPYDALLAADEATRKSFNWPDVTEGVSSWQERRPPRFPPYQP